MTANINPELFNKSNRQDSGKEMSICTTTSRCTIHRLWSHRFMVKL